MCESCLNAVGITLEIVGLAFAALGLWRSLGQYDGGQSERWWAPAGLGVAALGLLAQLVATLL